MNLRHAQWLSHRNIPHCNIYVENKNIEVSPQLGLFIQLMFKPLDIISRQVVTTFNDRYVNNK